MTDQPAAGRALEPAATPGCVRLRRWWYGSESVTWDRQQVRRCDEVLKKIPVPTPFDLERFRQSVERARKRPLAVTAVPTRFPKPHAMWCRGATVDHILVGSSWPREHYEHLALHGIGHMIFDHAGDLAVTQPIRDVLSKADLAWLRRYLARVVYTPEEEYQAEVFATRVRQLATTWPSQSHVDAPEALPNRMSSTLEYQPTARRRRLW